MRDTKAETWPLHNSARATAQKRQSSPVSGSMTNLPGQENGRPEIFVLEMAVLGHMKSKEFSEINFLNLTEPPGVGFSFVLAPVTCGADPDMSWIL